MVKSPVKNFFLLYDYSWSRCKQLKYITYFAPKNIVNNFPSVFVFSVIATQALMILSFGCNMHQVVVPVPDDINVNDNVGSVGELMMLMMVTEPYHTSNMDAGAGADGAIGAYVTIDDNDDDITTVKAAVIAAAAVADGNAMTNVNVYFDIVITTTTETITTTYLPQSPPMMTVNSTRSITTTMHPTMSATARKSKSKCANDYIYVSDDYDNDEDKHYIDVVNDDDNDDNGDDEYTE